MIKAGIPKQREISPYEMIAPSEPHTFWNTLLVFSTSQDEGLLLNFGLLHLY